MNLSDVTDLYDRGQYLSAYRLIEPSGGIDALGGIEGRIMAGRLANVLGANRLGAAIHLRTWREHPRDDRLAPYASFCLARLRGPIAALEYLSTIEPTSPKTQADKLSARAFLWAAMYDFQRAYGALDEAFKLDAQYVWLLVTKAQVLSAESRQEEALEVQREALAAHTLYRPAVGAMASNLVGLNRLDEAEELLTTATAQLECGDLLIQLATLKAEMDRHVEARADLEAAEQYFPLADRDRIARRRYAAVCSDVAYHCGEIDESIRLSRQVDTPYYTKVADHLEAHQATGRRVVLDVGFTLQHNMTCAPATLSTLTRFWDKPFEHLEIAEEICYDGTPAHKERAWVNEQGFHCREFSLTWETAIQLIDAGIPFSLTTVGLSMAHMQAVIGYDSRRGVLIVRDPNFRHHTEYLAADLIEQMKSTGPRGMAFVPAERAAELDALVLPDVEHYDDHHLLSHCLEEHDRAGAVKALRRMAKRDPKHRLTIYARARIASYDDDHISLLRCTNALLKQFPTDANQLLVKLRLLRENGTRNQRLELLASICDEPECEMMFQQEHARELAIDSRQHDEAMRFVRQCLRRNPVDATTFRIWTDLLWDTGQRDRALELLRYAACMDDKDESRAMSYFTAARVMNRADEVLGMLQDRFKRFAGKSGGPGRTLAEAYDQLYQTPKALAVLEEAIARRPDDGPLRLFAAEFYARNGQVDRGQQLLEEARPVSRRWAWLQTAAELARRRNQLAAALDLARQANEIDPLNPGSNQLVTELLGDVEGAAAVEQHLRRAVARFPNHNLLRTQLVETVGERDAAQGEQELYAFLKLHPEDAWAHRQLGFYLVEQRRWQDALAAAEAGFQRDPHAAVGHYLLGLVHQGSGDTQRARESFHRALSLSVDYTHAIVELVGLCNSMAERQQELRTVAKELERQVITGDALLTFRHYASASFRAEQVLRLLVTARQARSDLWHAWSAVVSQLLAMDKNEQALKVAKAAAARFPLLPPVLHDLADVYLQLEQPDEEMRTLRRALAINSRSAATLRRLAEAQERRGDKSARESLERAIASEPRNFTHRGALAEYLWSLGRRKEAVATISDAVRREPGYEWGWRQLAEWSDVLKAPKLLLDAAQHITRDRPHAPELWLQHAELIAQFPEQHEACVAAIDRALEIDPRNVDAYELRARVLAGRGQFDEAIAACRPAALGERIPLSLQARAAVVESQRGNMQLAITQMRQVVRQDKNNAFAWSQLANWYSAQQDSGKYLEATRRLLKLAPKNSVSWGYVADALMMADDREGAKKHLQRAFDLDASYVYAASELMEMDIVDEKYDQALATLMRVGPHLANDVRRAHRARIHCLAGDIEASLKAFDALCRTKLDDTEVVFQAVDELLRAGEAAEVKKRLVAAIRLPDASSLLPGVLVEVLAREADLPRIEKFGAALTADSDAWHNFALTYVTILGQARLPDQLGAFIEQTHLTLRKNADTWAAVGWSLDESGYHDDVHRWMQDWRDREKLRPNMLVPLATACVELGEYDESRALADSVVQLPHDQAVDIFRVTAAVSSAIQHETTAAARYVSQVNPATLSEYHRDLYTLVRTLCELLAEEPSPQGWSAVRQRWLRTLDKLSGSARGRPLLRRLTTQCELLLAEVRGTLAAKWRSVINARWQQWTGGRRRAG